MKHYSVISSSYKLYNIYITLILAIVITLAIYYIIPSNNYRLYLSNE